MQRLLLVPALLAFILMTAACGNPNESGAKVAETDYLAIFAAQEKAAGKPVKKPADTKTVEQKKLTPKKPQAPQRVQAASSMSNTAHPIVKPVSSIPTAARATQRSAPASKPSASVSVTDSRSATPVASSPATAEVKPEAKPPEKLEAKPEIAPRQTPVRKPAKKIIAHSTPTKPARETQIRSSRRSSNANTSVQLSGLWDHQVQQGRRWTVYTGDALEKYAPDLIDSHPSDIREYCPAYGNLDHQGRKVFWINFISAVSFKESSFIPSDSYKEKFHNSSGHSVVSRGLMALSLESSKLYGCDMRTEKDLEDPKLNLECGVKILGQWVVKTHRLAGQSGETWVGASRYWGVMRTPKKAAAIKRATNNLDFCKN